MVSNQPKANKFFLESHLRAFVIAHVEIHFLHYFLLLEIMLGRLFMFLLLTEF